jgi:hypothetical protein
MYTGIPQLGRRAVLFTAAPSRYYLPNTAASA